MSISNFQDKVIKGGCGKAIMLLAAASMAIGLGVTSCSRGDKFQALDAKGQPEKPFAKIGGVELPLAWIDDTIKQQAEQMGGLQALDNYPSEIKMSFYGQAVASVIQKGYVFMLASQKGVKVDETNLKKDLGIDTYTSFRAKIKKSLEEGGQLKPGATDKEMDDFISPQLQGRKLEDFYAEQMKSFDADMKDPVKKSKAILEVAGNLMFEKLRNEIKPTDAEIKTMFDTYEVKIIMTKGDDKAKIDKAYADIKGGKSFEDVANAVSEMESQDPKKKKGEVILPVPGSSLKMPDFEIIGKLTSGNYSEPVKTSGGYSMYKLVGKKTNVPPDFDKEKKKYANQYVNDKISQSLKSDLEKLQKDQKPDFQVKAYEALYLFSQASAKPDTKTQNEEFQKAYEVAKTVGRGDVGAGIASTVEVAVMQRLYTSPGADKAKYKANYMSALEKFLESDDKAWDKRRQLITMYKEDKQGDKAYAQLSTAIDKNVKYDPMGQANYSDMSALFQELKKDNMVKPEQVKEFEGKQKLWLDAKASYDKQQEDIKKLQEAEQKKAAAAQKEADKNKKPAEKK